MKIFSLKSFCKININLRVLKKLKNGYHSIQSFIVFSDIFDLVTVSQIKNPKDKIKFYGKFKKGIDNKSNTITNEYTVYFQCRQKVVPILFKQVKNCLMSRQTI